MWPIKLLIIKHMQFYWSSENNPISNWSALKAKLDHMTSNHPILALNCNSQLLGKNGVHCYSVTQFMFCCQIVKMTLQQICLGVTLVLLWASSLLADDIDTNYLVGTGIWDVTGPAAEINLVCCCVECCVDL